MKAIAVVSNVLGENTNARSNDKTLFILAGQKYGLWLSQAQKEAFYSMPSFETFRRIRQKLQENGKFIATDSIARQRKFKSWQLQQRIKETMPDKIENLINERLI